MLSSTRLVGVQREKVSPGWHARLRGKDDVLKGAVVESVLGEQGHVQPVEVLLHGVPRVAADDHHNIVGVVAELLQQAQHAS